MKTITTFMLAAVFAVSCNSSKKTTEKSAQEPLVGTFVLENIKSNADNSLELTLNAEDGSVNGNTDCNSYFGTYTTEGDNGISFSPLGATKMYCEGRMDAEKNIIAAYGAAASYSLKDGVFSLYDAEKNLILRAVRK